MLGGVAMVGERTCAALLVRVPDGDLFLGRDKLLCCG